jgi:hypothetical protein
MDFPGDFSFKSRPDYQFHLPEYIIQPYKPNIYRRNAPSSILQSDIIVVVLLFYPFNMSVYFNSKMELFAIIGEKISYLNKHLFNTNTIPDKETLTEIRATVDFLKDHKYKFMSQGLNQLEYIIRSAEEKLESL